MENNNSFIEQIELNLYRLCNSIAIRQYKGQIYSYGELYQDVVKMRSSWKSLGLVAGDKIALCGKSCYEWVVVYLAALIDNYIIVLLPENNSQESIQKLASHSECALLYIDEILFHTSFMSIPTLVAAFDLKKGKMIAKNRGIHKEPAYIVRDNEETCMIIYSSGTSGHIKGVMHSIKSIDFDVSNAIKTLPYKEGDYYLSVLPFSHLVGLVYDALATLCSGMSLTILGLPPAPYFIIPVIKSIAPSFFIAVPVILRKMIEYALGKNVSDSVNYNDYQKRVMDVFGDKCKFILTGGGPMPKEFESIIVRDWGIRLISGYGMTECTTISLSTPTSFKPFSCGKCLEGVSIRIDKSTTDDVGEILVKSPGLFKGYYNNINKTENSFTPDGWFRTGDLGFVDTEHFIFIKGRCKDMIVTSNGLNIYPDDIESKINYIEGVSESLVLQRDDKLVALVYLSNISQNVDKLMNSLFRINKEIPTFCAISKFEIVNEPFEKTEKGTIKRYKYK